MQRRGTEAREGHGHEHGRPVRLPAPGREGRAFSSGFEVDAKESETGSWVGRRTSFTNISMSRSMFAGGRAQETEGCGRGCIVATGTGAEAAARGPTTRTRALHSSPMLRAPPRTGLGVDRRARGRGQGEWGSGGRAQRNVGFSFRILLPSVPPNGNGEGRVQAGRPELGGGVDRCAPPYCTLRQGDK